jgi:hypothetical protein
MSTLEKFQAIIDHCKCEVSLEVRPNETMYQTVEAYFDDHFQGEGDESDKFEMAACIEAGVIYVMQAYPRTPIGFYVTHGPSLGYVVDRMFKGLKL